MSDDRDTVYDQWDALCREVMARQLAPRDVRAEEPARIAQALREWADRIDASKGGKSALCRASSGTLKLAADALEEGVV